MKLRLISEAYNDIKEQDKNTHVTKGVKLWSLL